jgi:hypothetical protein
VVDCALGDLKIPDSAGGVGQPCRANATSGPDLPKLQIVSLRDLHPVGASWAKHKILIHERAGNDFVHGYLLYVNYSRTLGYSR